MVRTPLVIQHHAIVSGILLQNLHVYGKHTKVKHQTIRQNNGKHAKVKSRV